MHNTEHLQSTLTSEVPNAQYQRASQPVSEAAEEPAYAPLWRPPLCQ